MTLDLSERLKRAELLCLDPYAWLLSQVQEWPGAVDENLVRRYTGAHKPLVERALDELLLWEFMQFRPARRTSRNRFVGDLASLDEGERVVRQVRMFYLGGRAGAFLHHRDGVASNSATARHNSAMNQDHRKVRPHRSHTGQLDDVVTSLMLQGYDIRSGRRDLVHAPGLPQLVPDAVLTTVVANVPFSLMRIETTLDAEVVSALKDRLFPMLNSMYESDRQVFVLVCHDQRLASLAQAEGDAWVRLLESPHQVLAVTAQDVSDMRAFTKPPKSLWRLFRVVRFFVEYERSARYRERIRAKLLSYVLLAKAGRKFALLFITETDAAERFVVEEAAALMKEHDVELMAVTSTYDKIVRRLPTGDPGVWSHRGSSINVLPI